MSLILALCALAAPFCARTQEAAEPREPATLFTHARFVVNDGRGGAVEAMLVRDGRIVRIGSEADLAALEEARDARRVDLGGGIAVPGLQDAHGHLESYGASLESVDLRGAKSYEELIARVAAQAEKQKEGTWIVGRGWDQNLWSTNAFPHHLLLSTAVPKHPVLLERVDGHAAIANRAALAAAKLEGPFTAEPKVQGGRVFLDANGAPTGVLLDAAVELVQRAMPPVDAATIERHLLRAQAKLLEYGITCVHDMGISRRALDVLRALRDRGALSLRVVAYVDAGGPELEDARLAGLPLAPDPWDLLSAPGVKLLADGALGSRGAALLDDYSDAPGERGLLLLTEDDLAARLVRVASLGLQPAVHAIGDRANRLVLDLYEKIQLGRPGFRDLRPRIEHAQVVSAKDWPRFPELGVIPSMQPTHAISDGPWVRARLGGERTRGAYAWRALAPELGKLAFGSDFPVESPDPLAGLFAARTRQVAGTETLLPEQCLDGNAALAGFTSGAAYACRQEDRRGRLLPGYFADLTILDVDPTTCEPAALKGARARMTVINGAIVWRAR